MGRFNITTVFYSLCRIDSSGEEAAEVEQRESTHQHIKNAEHLNVMYICTYVCIYCPIMYLHLGRTLAQIVL